MTMFYWSKKISEFVKDNYELVTTDIEKDEYETHTFNIYKGKGLNELPLKLIGYIKRNTKCVCLDLSDSRRAFYHNYDFGRWDAVYCIRYTKSPKSGMYVINAYVSAILRRPCTMLQHLTYDENFKFYDEPFKRLQYIYDSSNDIKPISEQICEAIGFCDKVLYCKGDCTKCVKYTKY